MNGTKGGFVFVVPRCVLAELQPRVDITRLKFWRNAKVRQTNPNSLVLKKYDMIHAVVLEGNAIVCPHCLLVPHYGALGAFRAMESLRLGPPVAVTLILFTILTF